MNHLNKFTAALLMAISIGASAQPDRVLPLETVGMETIMIKGPVKSWIQKLCIDGQAYLLLSGVTGFNGISPSFKDGKPEQCQLKPAK